MKPDSAILTIAIPTYNRATKLAAQLERLLPQLTPEVRLCVYDNASPDNTREVVANFPGVSYFRAATNCGAGRNIFRCFEECSTEWLWVLSDDDSVSATAGGDLLAILKNQDCDLVHLSSYECRHPKDAIETSVESFLNRLTFSALLWISSGVYRTQSFRPLFGLYNQSLSTWAPHLLMTLNLLESRRGRVFLSERELIMPPTQRVVSDWSALDCLLRISQAPEYLEQPDTQRMFSSEIFLEWYNTQMVYGLRETGANGGVQKWQRIRKQARVNLKAYRARGPVDYVLRNWFRAGQRWRSLCVFKQVVQLQLLGCCPAGWFHALARLLPLAADVRDNYNKRGGHIPYA